VNNPDISKVRETFAKEVGAKVLAEYDQEYPECLCVVVLDDVGPEAMGKAVQAVAKDGVVRVCANVIVSEFASRIESEFSYGGFQAAWDESWNVCIATVRSE
jgi:hypothetical protein